MDPIKVVVNINAPAQRVFEILCDVERWPEWTPTMQSVQRSTPGPFVVGSEARVLQPKFRPAVWKVTSLEAARHFIWASAAPGVTMEAGHDVAAQGAACVVTLWFRVSGLLAPLVRLMYGKVIAEYVNTEARSLKTRSETPS